MRYFLAATVIVVSTLTATVRADDAEDLKDTVWKPTEGKNAGTPFPKDELDAITLLLTDGKYQVKHLGQDEGGTFKIDATKTPKTMDITAVEGQNKGKTVLAIYELSGDTLKVCYDAKGGPRPAMFESTADNKLVLVVYKKKK